jgi:hypothetical protein
VVQPEKYARAGGDRIAYQVLGAGPPDLVMTTGNYSHVDMVWEDPGMARFLRTLASFSRLIVSGCTPARSSCAGTTSVGPAVHVAARVMVAAGPGEILVSRTVRDLAAGSDVTRWCPSVGWRT